jgi:uncharacterized protein (TIGR02452 family)
MKKNSRISTAKETLERLERKFYTLPTGEVINFRFEQNFAEDNTKFCSADELDEQLAHFQAKQSYITAYKVTQQTTIEGLIDVTHEAEKIQPNTETKIGILNFASAKNAGGGFLNGAQAQEESLARSSGLYPCLLKAPQYYDIHRGMKTCLYSDNMIYAPQVPFFKNDDGNYLPRFYKADVITSPAVNAGVVRRQEGANNHKIVEVTRLRMQKVLMLFAENECVDIILGAWGCGVFQNVPAEMASLFHECLEGNFKNVFRKVLFAIKSDKPAMLAPFQERFGS